MEDMIKDLFKDAQGNISSFQQFAAKALPLLFTVLIALVLTNFIVNFCKKIIKKSKLPKSMHPFVASGIKAALYFLIILSVCSRLGIDITSLVAAFSVIGVAVSLSIQNTLANVMAGFSLLFTKQFDVDDYIEAGGVSGSVMRIGLASCKLKTFDGKDIYVPNSSIISEKIINYSREPIRRVDITIGTSYNESVDRVKASLTKVVDNTPEIIKDKDIFIGITGFGDSAINYSIRVWVKNSDYWKAYLPMLERIKRTFEEDNIEIPFNQLDVHIKNN